MAGDWLRWVIGIALVAHGIGHVLFVPLLQPALGVAQDGASSLLANVVGGTATSWIGSVVAGSVAVAFVVAGGALIMGAEWWRPAAIAASVVSFVLVGALWGSLPSSSALLAVAFDLIVLVALLVLRWPGAARIGA